MWVKSLPCLDCLVIWQHLKGQYLIWWSPGNARPLGEWTNQKVKHVTPRVPCTWLQCKKVSGSRQALAIWTYVINSPVNYGQTTYCSSAFLKHILCFEFLLSQVMGRQLGMIPMCCRVWIKVTSAPLCSHKSIHTVNRSWQHIINDNSPSQKQEHIWQLLLMAVIFMWCQAVMFKVGFIC